ncbi:MAG TPA: ferritin-like domain-containing protein [Planctomicrobium sp.]|nr:ferritin-like domain-containing protein [Planctomicrobium sp.]
MGLFTSTNLESFEDLFLVEIQDLYDAEHQLTQALPKMADAAGSVELRSAFQTHLVETKGHINRLEQVFREFGQEPKRKTCLAMKGLIAEGDELIKSHGKEDVRDAGLIMAAQRVEHYEMAGYGAARSHAQKLGLSHSAQLLQETLDEEGNADKILTQIAEESVNPAAQQA